ncbi:protein JINGUBANG [Rhododendron vialii]|uniref:protein JINGUBANG n=1 Tax=Rhododendron vialii TaxID=182163 RepID=UPI00265DBFEB|nr:protein JINGUBANG [Rhododendron vialii]
MKIRSWLSTFSTTTTMPPLNHLSSGTSSSSDNTSSSASTSLSSLTSYNSLQTNLSLQTLPSIPSLQTNLLLSPSSSLSSPLPLSLHHTLPSLSPCGVIASLALRHPLLYAASGHQIHVFDVTDNYALVDTFNSRDPSSGSVKSITFHRGKVLTAHQDSRIRVWELAADKKHELVATLPTVKDRLRRSVFPKNYVTVRRHKKRLWIEHHDAVSGLAASGDLICSVSWDKCLKIWRPSDFRCVQSVEAHDDAINAVAVSGDGIIYTASADCRIKVWGIPFGERQYGPIATLEKHKSAVNALALNGDGTVLFSGACDRSILVWEREDSANYMVVTGALRGHSKAILCLINVSDLLFSGSADRTVRIWQRGHDGKFCCLTVSDAHEKPVRSLAVVVDEGGSAAGGGGVRVFSGSLDGDIKVWEVGVSKVSGNLHSNGF